MGCGLFVWFWGRDSSSNRKKGKKAILIRIMDCANGCSGGGVPTSTCPRTTSIYAVVYRVQVITLVSPSITTLATRAVVYLSLTHNNNNNK